jgi:ribosome-binding protein aMBF1 (putative translation factor)
MAKTASASEILKRQTGIDPKVDPEMQQIAEDYRVAQMIFDAREEAGLTQQQLADAVGTTQSVISQLESADYEGHSLSVLRRIAKALNRRVEIRLAPA